MTPSVGDKQKNQYYLRDHAIAGATSGVITRALLSPLDLLKIRFQLQTSGSKASRPYGGILQSFTRIVGEEGVASLWKGHVPGQFLSVTYGVAQFCSYEVILKGMERFNVIPHGAGRDGLVSRAGVNFVCGGLAGCCATLTAHPMDVLRTRLVAQRMTKDSKIYTGMRHAVSHMWRTEGFRAFFRGLSPTLLLVFPQTGLQFSIYHSLGYLWRQTRGENSFLGFRRSSVCGLVAGVLSKLAVLPLDLVKKRLQVQGFERAWSSFGQPVKYHGVVHCFRHVAANEGLLAFYKGVVPSVLKAGLAVAIIFTSYEQCLVSLQYLRDRQ